MGVGSGLALEADRLVALAPMVKAMPSELVTERVVAVAAATMMGLPVDLVADPDPAAVDTPKFYF